MAVSRRTGDVARIAMEAIPESGRAISIEFRITDGLAEIWVDSDCCAVFERAALRQWITVPACSLTTRGAELRSGERDGDGRPALRLPVIGMTEWVLSPSVLAHLRSVL